MNREIGDTIYLEEVLSALEELRAESRRTAGEAFHEGSPRRDPMEGQPADEDAAPS